MKYYTTIKKKKNQTNVKWKNRSESHRHNIEPKKPETNNDTYILYDSIYMKFKNKQK